MTARSNHLGIALCTIALSAIAFGNARADSTATSGATPAPASSAPTVSLHVAQDTQMPDVLKMLSDQTGTPLIPDKSVFATVGTVSINKTTLPTVFKFLKTQEPGLSWQRIFIAADQPVPDGDTLYQQMQTLKAVSLTGLVVPGDADTLSFQKVKTDSDKPAAVPAGMREAYLFTDDVLRAKTAEHRKDEAKAEAAQAPVQKFTDNVNNLAANFSQLSPADQAAMLPMLMGDMRQLMQSMDPSARQAMQQQMRQQRQQQRQQSQQNQQAGGQ